MCRAMGWVVDVCTQILFAVKDAPRHSAVPQTSRSLTAAAATEPRTE